MEKNSTFAMPLKTRVTIFFAFCRFLGGGNFSKSIFSVCPLRQGISKKYRYRLEISLEICVHFVSTKK